MIELKDYDARKRFLQYQIDPSKIWDGSIIGSVNRSCGFFKNENNVYIAFYEGRNKILFSSFNAMRDAKKWIDTQKSIDNVM